MSRQTLCDRPERTKPLTGHHLLGCVPFSHINRIISSQEQGLTLAPLGAPLKGSPASGTQLAMGASAGSSCAER
jgi:hypothetical protein